MTPHASPYLSAIGATPPVWLSQHTLNQIERIVHRVAIASGIHPSALFLQRRGPQRVARTRQLVMAILRESTDLTLRDIGQTFAGRDHGTVIHACKATRRRIKNHSAIQALYQTLTKPTA